MEAAHPAVSASVDVKGSEQVVRVKGDAVHPLEDAGAELIGRRIDVLWQDTPDGDMWYSGEITAFAGEEHTVLYDDGDSAQYDLTTVTLRMDGVVYEPASDSDTDDAAQPGGDSDVVHGPDDDGDIPMVETLRHEPEVLSPRPPLAPLGASAPSLQTQSRRQLLAVPPLSRSATARRAADDTDGGLAPLVARRDDQVEEDSPGDGLHAPASDAGVDASDAADARVDAEVVVSGSGPDEATTQLHGDDNASVASSPPVDASDVPDDAVADDVLQSAAVLAAATEDTGLLRPDADVPEPPTAQEHAAAIDNIRWGLQDATVPRYEDALEDLVRPEEIVIATIPKEEAEAAERKMEEARLRAAAAQAEEFHARQRAIAARETRARRRVLDQERSSQDRIRKREAQAMERAATREASIRRVFVKAEAQLKDSIAAQQGVVEERYGNLARSTRAGARRLRATWRHLPQPMELHLLCVRALKDKVPAGRYVALVTLYDRLGGQPLRWSKQDLSGGVGVGQPAATQPVHHRGRFYDTELEVDQWVYSLGPSEAETNPSMVYVIELFLLGNRRNPVDQVVGWTVLPYTDATFQPASGRYRLPMLRGEVDLDIDKFSSFESAVAQDLDRWLANVYVDVRKLPRERIVGKPAKSAKAADAGAGARSHSTRLKGKAAVMQREFDVELAYTSELLRLPPHRHTGSGSDSDSNDNGGGWGSDYDANITNADDAEAAAARNAAAGKPQFDARRGEVGMGAQARLVGPTATNATTAPAPAAIARPAFSFLSNGGAAASSDAGTSVASGGLRSSLKGGRAESLRSRDSRFTDATRSESARKRRVRMGISRLGVVTEGSAGAGAGAGTSGRPSSLRRRANASSKRRRGRTGASSVFRGGASTTSGTGATATRASGEDTNALLGQYQYAVTRVQGTSSKGMAAGRVSDTARKLRHLWTSVASDFAGSSLLSFEFFVQLVLLLVALWLRIYAHYIGEWLFLKGERVPVFSFTATPYTVELKYVAGLVPMEIELGVVMMGQLFNCLVMAMLMCVAWTFNKALGHFPEVSSRFVAMYGLGVCLDAVLVLLVDIAAGSYNCKAITACVEDATSDACDCVVGDSFKLYERFLIDEGNGVVGIFLTVFVDVVLFMLSALLLYMFLLHVHLDGRMLDVYRRLHATDEEFFVPHDMEVSPGDLQWVVTKARRWRGPKGTQRKMAVCDYVLTDPLDPAFKEATTHFIIYHADLDGRRELYRHFLRMPDGTAMEMFGDLSQHFGGGFGALGELLSKREGGGIGGLTLARRGGRNAVSAGDDAAGFFAGLAHQA